MPSHVPPEYIQGLDVGAAEQLDEGREGREDPVRHLIIGTQQQVDEAKQLLVFELHLLQLSRQFGVIGRGARPSGPSKGPSRSHLCSAMLHASLSWLRTVCASLAFSDTVRPSFDQTAMDARHLA